MGNRSHIRNAGDFKAYGIQGTNRRLTPWPRPLDPDFKIFYATFLCRLTRIFCGNLRCERSALTRSFEAIAAGSCPGQGISLTIGYRNDRIVEGSVNMRDSLCHILFDFLTRTCARIGFDHV